MLASDDGPSAGSVQGYTRVSKLGVGAFASTHLVQEDSSGKKLAMKRMPCKTMNAVMVRTRVRVRVSRQSARARNSC